MDSVGRQLWDEFTGRAKKNRERDAVLRSAVARLRRAYLLQLPSGSVEYDRGFGDAIAKMTRLLDPDM
jgi:hypothetical protein